MFTIAVPVILAVLLAACASPAAKGRTQTDNEYFWKRHYVVPIEMSARDLNDEASDPATDRNSRCQDVFYLFAAYVRPGCSSRQVGDVMQGAKSLEEARVVPVGGLGGWVPVFAGRNEEMFAMSLFPDKTGWSDWNIYFVLSRSEHGTREEWLRKGIDFLKGSMAYKRIRLREFALCYPQCKIERFTTRGAGLMVNDSGYRPGSDKR